MTNLNEECLLQFLQKAQHKITLQPGHSTKPVIATVHPVKVKPTWQTPAHENYSASSLNDIFQKHSYMSMPYQSPDV